MSLSRFDEQDGRVVPGNVRSFSLAATFVQLRNSIIHQADNRNQTHLYSEKPERKTEQDLPHCHLLEGADYSAKAQINGGRRLGASQVGYAQAARLFFARLNQIPNFKKRTPIKQE